VIQENLMTVQEYEPGLFRLWQPGEPVAKTCRAATRTTSYEDGRSESEDVAVEPYEAIIRPTSLRGWSVEEKADCGLYEPEPFATPDGKRTVGPCRYESIDGLVREVYDLEDIPPPPPPPTKEEQVDRLLSDYGLTRDELKAALVEPVEAHVQ
jgi:hypothetical protein